MDAGVLDEITYVKLYRGNVIPLSACRESCLCDMVARSSQRCVSCYSSRTYMGPSRLLFVVSYSVHST